MSEFYVKALSANQIKFLNLIVLTELIGWEK